MKPTQFLDQLDDAAITNAIAEAEKSTSGEVRVYIAHGNVTDAIAEARKQFAKLGMQKTRDRNAVLIFVAPKTQQFAIIGDEGIHQKCGDTLWQELADEMTSELKNAHYTQALVTTIRHVGDVLSRHFPRRPDDIDELPNAPIRS